MDNKVENTSNQVLDMSQGVKSALNQIIQRDYTLLDLLDTIDEDRVNKDGKDNVLGLHTTIVILVAH